MARFINSYRVWAVIIGVFFCDQLLGHEKTYDSMYASLKNSPPLEQYDSDKDDEDEALKEAYVLASGIYKNLVELVVLYYCKDMVVDAQFLYDKILMETCKDAFSMIKCLALYIPLICKNKKTSKKAKVLKLAGVGCVMTVLVSSLHTFCAEQISQKNKKLDASRRF